MNSAPGFKVTCLEDIAYRNGWISEEKMCELAKPIFKKPVRSIPTESY